VRSPESEISRERYLPVEKRSRSSLEPEPQEVEGSRKQDQEGNYSRIDEVLESVEADQQGSEVKKQQTGKTEQRETSLKRKDQARYRPDVSEYQGEFKTEGERKKVNRQQTQVDYSGRLQS